MAVALMEHLMESIAHTGDLGGPKEPVSDDTSGMPQGFATPSTEGWPTPAAARRSEEPVAGFSSVASEPDLELEQLQESLVREALRFRQNTSGSLTVIVCLDDRAELLVHFAQRDGGVDAIARCEPGDAPRLGILWPRLQEALAKRRIRLAPLRSVASHRPPASSTQSTSPDTELRRNQNQLPLNRPGWETWA